MGNERTRNMARRVAAILVVLAAGMFLVQASSSPAYAAEGQPALQAGSITTQESLGEQLYGTVTAVPTNKKSMYEVYSTYFFVNAGPNACAGCNLYLVYRQKAGKKWGKWKAYNGVLYSYNNYEVKGLKPNRKTQVALVYASLYSDDIGQPSKVVTFKTGVNKKPAVKSVRVQAVGLKKHKQHHVSPYTGYVYRTVYDIWYTYKIKTTVTLKKPLKSGYLMINSKTFKAKGKNKGKKTFTVTTVKKTGYSSPRGSKYTVSVAKYQNKTWKGYTKLFQKNYKIK